MTKRIGIFGGILSGPVFSKQICQKYFRIDSISATRPEDLIILYANNLFQESYFLEYPVLIVLSFGIVKATIITLRKKSPPLVARPASILATSDM